MFFSPGATWLSCCILKTAAVVGGEGSGNEKHKILITYGRENICVGKLMKLIPKLSN